MVNQHQIILRNETAHTSIRNQVHDETITGSLRRQHCEQIIRETERSHTIIPAKPRGHSKPHPHRKRQKVTHAHSTKRQILNTIFSRKTNNRIHALAVRKRLIKKLHTITQHELAGRWGSRAHFGSVENIGQLPCIRRSILIINISVINTKTGMQFSDEEHATSITLKGHTVTNLELWGKQGSGGGQSFDEISFHLIQHSLKLINIRNLPRRPDIQQISKKLTVRFSIRIKTSRSQQSTLRNTLKRINLKNLKKIRTHLRINSVTHSKTVRVRRNTRQRIRLTLTFLHVGLRTV